MKRFLLSAIASAALTGCSTVEFYSQAARGQWELLANRRSNREALADPQVSSALKDRIRLAEEIRAFASARLDLPGNDAYGKIAELHRDHLVWVVFAAPEFSLEAKRWWYPFVGRLDYRGYFTEQGARKLAEALRGKGYDTSIDGVDAYSTLGYFHDPLLDTFLFYPDPQLAEVIFHELTHHRIFLPGGTEFNESLAEVAAEEGVKVWLRASGRTTELAKYEKTLSDRDRFHLRIVHVREELRDLYRSDASPAEMRERKGRIFADLQAELIARTAREGKRPVQWLTGQWNNANLVAFSLYSGRKAELRRLFQECGGDFRAFFQRLQKPRGN